MTGGAAQSPVSPMGRVKVPCARSAGGCAPIPVDASRRPQRPCSPRTVLPGRMIVMIPGPVLRPVPQRVSRRSTSAESAYSAARGLVRRRFVTSETPPVPALRPRRRWLLLEGGCSGFLTASRHCGRRPSRSVSCSTLHHPLNIAAGIRLRREISSRTAATGGVDAAPGTRCSTRTRTKGVRCPMSRRCHHVTADEARAVDGDCLDGAFQPQTGMT